ncbi:MAG: glycosyltransferase [Candidatus Roizmanbacteria bacterium]|nr:MAG: glycosyltransferase [Candidatus Roizmanbacteria bacterium]
MNNISAIIVVQNNPSHLKETLDSIEDFVSEIIIADIGIDKETLNFLDSFKKVKVIKIEKSVPYVELIREELKQKTKGEYILFIDPDEVIPQDLKNLILKNLSDYDYFSIPRKNIIFSKWIKNSRWWPDYQVRFFKKNKVIWPTKIHQQPKVEGIGLIIEPQENIAIIHYNYLNLDEYIEKSRRYAKAEASEFIKDNKEFTLAETIKKSLSEFVSRFFANKGYEDGMHGFVLSILQMFYYFLVYFYYWEQKKYFEVKENEILYNSQNLFQQGFYEINHWIDKRISKNWINRIKGKLRNFLIKTILK